MNELTTLQQIAIWTLPVIFAITVHETAHGWVASKLGDRTAELQGRLTINPIKHIDPIGTVIVPLVLLALGGVIFGWARPVPINPQNFKNPSKDMAWVAIAGPASNLLMAIGWAILIKIGSGLTETLPEIGLFLVYSGLAGISINLILLVLNLLPIPPLDGSRVVSAFLPPKLAYQYNLVEPYGFFILLGLLFIGLLGPILSGPYQVLQQIILGLVGV